jgi:hypothetical protein
MKNRKPYLAIFLAAFVCLSSAAQQIDNKARMEIVHVSDFEVSGTGSAPEWDKTDWTEIPQRNNENIDYQTRAKVLWSETGIYFLVSCEDHKINATLQGHNLNLWEEDVVEVFLMPDEKYPLYFEYQLSPLNYELTLLIPNLDGNFLGWLPWKYEGERKTRHNASVQTAVGNNAVTGWMAEFFIPWKLMEPMVKSAPTPGTQWKANIYRIDYDSGMTRFSWNPTTRNFHEPHNFGTFVFK